MEQRREVELQDINVTSMGVLLGVVAAAFIALGVTIYFFAEDQSSSITAANNPPTQTEPMMRNKSSDPNTVGRGDQ